MIKESEKITDENFRRGLVEKCIRDERFFFFFFFFFFFHWKRRRG